MADLLQPCNLQNQFDLNVDHSWQANYDLGKNNKGRDRYLNRVLNAIESSESYNRVLKHIKKDS